MGQLAIWPATSRHAYVHAAPTSPQQRTSTSSLEEVLMLKPHLDYAARRMATCKLTQCLALFLL